MKLSQYEDSGRLKSSLKERLKNLFFVFQNEIFIQHAIQHPNEDAYPVVVYDRDVDGKLSVFIQDADGQPIVSSDAGGNPSVFSDDDGNPILIAGNYYDSGTYQVEENHLSNLAQDIIGFSIYSKDSELKLDDFNQVNFVKFAFEIYYLRELTPLKRIKYKLNSVLDSSATKITPIDNLILDDIIVLEYSEYEEVIGLISSKYENKKSIPFKDISRLFNIKGNSYNDQSAELLNDVVKKFAETKNINILDQLFSRNSRMPFVKDIILRDIENYQYLNSTNIIRVIDYISSDPDLIKTFFNKENNHHLMDYLKESKSSNNTSRRGMRSSSRTSPFVSALSRNFDEIKSSLGDDLSSIKWIADSPFLSADKELLNKLFNNEVAKASIPEKDAVPNDFGNSEIDRPVVRGELVNDTNIPHQNTNNTSNLMAKAAAVSVIIIAGLSSIVAGLSIPAIILTFATSGLASLGVYKGVEYYQNHKEEINNSISTVNYQTPFSQNNDKGKNWQKSLSDKTPGKDGPSFF